MRLEMKLCRRSAAILVALVLVGAQAALADDSSLAQSKLDPIALLAPPPSADSAE